MQALKVLTLSITLALSIHNCVLSSSMKNFYVSIFSILTIFLLIMGSVVVICFKAPSHQTGHDPAKIAKMRQHAL